MWCQAQSAPGARRWAVAEFNPNTGRNELRTFRESELARVSQDTVAA